MTAVAHCDDGAGLLSASWDGTVRRWDRATGRETGRIEEIGVAFTALAVGPGGRVVWVGRSDGAVVGYPSPALGAGR